MLIVPEHCTDFGSTRTCNSRDLMALKYYADSKHCGTKTVSTFRALEDRFDSLDECCQTKFPQSVSECCEAGDTGCSLSGNIKFIPVSKECVSKVLGTLGSNYF
jgi:hypothetical protein